MDHGCKVCLMLLRGQLDVERQTIRILRLGNKARANNIQ